MTRASDMSPEERYAHQERTRRALEGCHETDIWLAERDAERRATGADLEERHAERLRQQEARAQRPDHPPAARPAPPPPPRDWVAEGVWIAGIVNRKIKAYSDKTITPLADEIGRHCGRTDNRIDALEKRLGESDAAVVELLRALEARLDQLEQRAIQRPEKPRLVASGGADDR